MCKKKPADPHALDSEKNFPANDVGDFAHESHGQTNQHPMRISSAESRTHLSPFLRAVEQIDQYGNRKDRFSGTAKSLLHPSADVLNMGSESGRVDVVRLIVAP